MTVFGGLLRRESVSRKCKRCSRETLETEEFVEKVQQKGWTVHPLTQKPQPPPGFRGGVFINEFVDLENQRGFQCKHCKRVYCMDCLYHYAPDHPNGGKACFKCGGAFRDLQRKEKTLTKEERLARDWADLASEKAEIDAKVMGYSGPEGGFLSLKKRQDQLQASMDKISRKQKKL